MKIRFLVWVFLLVGVFSCRKETIREDFSMSPPQLFVPASDDDRFAPTPLYWKVGIFTINKEDVTRKFDGYRFEFFADHSLYAFNGTFVVPGKWAISGDECNIEFFTGGIITNALQWDVKDFDFFDEMNGSWHILSKYPISRYPSSKSLPLILEMSGFKLHKILQFEKI